MMARSSHCVHVRSICWQSVKANGQVAVVMVIIMVVLHDVVVAAACKQVSSASAAHESQKTQSEASLGGNTKLKLAKNTQEILNYVTAFAFALAQSVCR